MIGSEERQARAMTEKGAEHLESSFGREYWLRRCEGFRVEAPGGRIGQVRSIRFGDSAEPEVLEVRAGLLGRRTLLIPVSDVETIISKERRLILCGSPRLLGSEPAED
jgi:hypothetical protein